MGEKQNQPFQLSFNASLKVDSQGSRVTSDGGLVLVRELDERLGLSELIEQHLTDSGGRTRSCSHVENFFRKCARRCNLLRLRPGLLLTVVPQGIQALLDRDSYSLGLAWLRDCFISRPCWCPSVFRREDLCI